jgi:hypothetical protein
VNDSFLASGVRNESFTAFSALGGGWRPAGTGVPPGESC